jgi:glycogen debranching enzyme
MSSQPDSNRLRPSHDVGPTISPRTSADVTSVQSVTVNPDTAFASEGAPEWLVTNGLGGYASGTLTGLVTRRFHGYLVAALPAPRGRTLMLNHLRKTVVTDKGSARLSEQPDPQGIGEPLVKPRDFRLELGLPVWTFEHEGNVIEKRIVMPHRQNTVFVT